MITLPLIQFELDGMGGPRNRPLNMVVRHSGRVAYRIVQRDGCLIYLLDMRPKSARLPSSTPPWLKSDLLFLRLSLDSGMSVAEIAGFLARDEKEVREKAEDERHAV
jgi:hypothetical protein